MKFRSDIDIDFANRDDILQHIRHVSAHLKSGHKLRKHPTGVYVTEIPYDPINDWCALDYHSAENRGYVKLDFLNVWIYKYVRDENHLTELMRDPKWNKLKDKEFFEKLIHIGDHYDSMLKMPQDIDSIPRMAMFLSVIRPGKKHLIGKPWADVATTVWDQGNDGYSFKKSHSIAYAHLVVVHMNLLDELGLHAFDEGDTSSLDSSLS